MCSHCHHQHRHQWTLPHYKPQSLSCHPPSHQSHHSSAPEWQQNCIHSTTTIPVPDLPLMAGHAHIFPDLTNHSLISVSQLCEHRCEALFTTDHVVISKNSKPILMGNQSPNRLWTTPVELPTHFNMQANLVYNHLLLPAQIVQFLHAALFSLATSMLLNAIVKNDLTTWPGLSTKTIQQHLPRSMAMAKGHLNQQHQNTQNTKSHAQDTDFQPTPASQQTQEYYCATINTTDLNHIMYSDLTS